MRKLIQVVDNFCPQIQRVRDAALAAGIGAWCPSKGEIGSSVYHGMGFYGEHSWMLHSLAGAIGTFPFSNNMFVRVTNEETEKAYVHSDRESGTQTCVCYLSEHAGEASGTGFYRHRKTGLVEMPTMQELHDNPDFAELRQDIVHGGEKEWEQTDFVKGIFNRAVIFHAPLFHARCPKHGFGSTPETGRMVWVSHFTTMSPNGGLCV